MPYATGPYSSHGVLPVPSRPELTTARKLDVSRKRYEIDTTTGGYESMNATAQRVVLLVAFALRDFQQDYITDQDNERRRQAVITALQPMTRAVPPDIKRVTVVVERNAPGSVKTRVTYYEATTGQKNELQLT